MTDSFNKWVVLGLRNLDLFKNDMFQPVSHLTRRLEPDPPVLPRLSKTLTEWTKLSGL